MTGNTRIDIAFGRSHLAVTMPAEADVQVIRKRQLPKLPDPGAALRAALDVPVAAPPLRELAAAKRSACILICDITRPVPNHLFLRSMIEDPLAVQCNLIGKPLHEEQLEIVRMLGSVYALNTVIDEARDLVYVNFGEVIASHLAAVAFIDKATRVPVDRRFGTIVTSSAGYPLDKTYYQTVKGMVTPLDILAPGGTLIIASQCEEGFGSPEFRAAQQRLVELGPERFLATLTAKSLAEIDEWQTEMQLKPMRKGRIQLYTTGLDAESRAITGVELIDSVEDAIRASILRTGDRGVAVIPEGPYVVPVLGTAPGA